ncbi:MAG: hypothetical protein L6R30_26205, partial [Thermoanaerobaculia bacterium]|nr:hypothetical protein [Thermoanaerobaculia bacterium]
VAEPKTRIGGFGLNLEDLIGDECPLTLGLRRGYAVEGWGIAEEERPDPWGLFELNDVWKAVKTYVEVGLDTTRGNLKSAARLGLGMADAAAGGRIMGAARALDSAASTKGSAGERLAAAYGAYERGKRATMSMGFSEAADKLQHAQDLVGVGGIDRGSSQLAEGILEGDLDKAGRGLAEFVGGAGQLAGTAAAVYAPFAPKAAPGAQMNLSAGNPRNNVPLTETQMAEVRAYTQEVRITDDAMQFYSGDTAYVPNWDTLLVGPDVFPGPAGAGPAGTLGANARIGMRGALSHEIVGHRAAAQAGRTNASSVLEEAQASIRAARFGPGLTASERFVLLRDAVARLAKEGIKVKDVKDQLWIQAP